MRHDINNELLTVDVSRSMKTFKRFKIRPLKWLMLMSFLGFTFFACFTILSLIYRDELKIYLKNRYEINFNYMIPFMVFGGIQAFAFLIITIQLLIAKPTKKKVIVPLVIAVSTSFVLLVAVDFFIEYHLMHPTLKETYTKTHKVPTDDSSNKKKGKGFKLGYFIIYASTCVVVWFLFLAYKDLEEEIENKKKENEPMEIVISHIT